MIFSAALRDASHRTAAHRVATQLNGRPFGGGTFEPIMVGFKVPKGIKRRIAAHRVSVLRCSTQRNG